jgi:hypothetical protein
MTPGEIKDLIDAIYHGTADPDDAKKLLKLFCDCIDNSEPIPDDILIFLKHAFTSIIKEEKSANRALGLKRKRGTPRRDEEKDTLVALQFLKLLNSGEPHVSARLMLTEKLFISEGQVKKCWARYEDDARLLLRIEKHLEDHSEKQK